MELLHKFVEYATGCVEQYIRQTDWGKNQKKKLIIYLDYMSAYSSMQKFVGHYISMFSLLLLLSKT